MGVKKFKDYSKFTAQLFCREDFPARGAIYTGSGKAAHVWGETREGTS